MTKIHLQALKLVIAEYRRFNAQIQEVTKALGDLKTARALMETRRQGKPYPPWVVRRKR